MNIKLTNIDIINLLIKFEYLREEIFIEILNSIQNIEAFRLEFKQVFYSKPFINSEKFIFYKELNLRSIKLEFSETKLIRLTITNTQTNKILLEIK